MANTKKSQLLLSAAVLALGLLVSYALIAQAQISAHPEANISYPVAELGGCENEQECHAYCDEPDHYRECFAFAKANGLLEGPLADKDEAELERFAAILQEGGPGGCQSQAECEAYCSTINNLDECLAFAEANDILEDEELEEMRQIKSALDAGVPLPGGCQSEAECELYCQNGDHIEECLAFAEAAGFLEGDELEEARIAMEFMIRGETPGGCRSERECDAYCKDPNNFQECIAFAEKAGFISPEEAEIVRKTGGVGPGGCQGRECETYCDDDAHFEECIAFAAEHGLISEEELEIVRKTGGKGPGGCVRDECETFCDNPENRQVCFEFATEHGLLSEEDARGFEEGKQRILEAFDQASPEVKQCLDDALGANFVERVQSGDIFPSEETGNVMQRCFEQFGGFGGDDHGGEGFGGPGPSPSSGPSSGIDVRDGQLGVTVDLKFPSGIQSFEILPADGPRYSGGVPGCPPSFSAETNIPPTGFPLTVNITDCDGSTESFSVDSFGGFSNAPSGPAGEGFPPAGGSALDNFPPEVLECVARTHGADVIENLRTGQAPPPPDLEQTVRACFEQIQRQSFDQPSQDFEGSSGSFQEPVHDEAVFTEPTTFTDTAVFGFTDVPPEIQACVGEDVFAGIAAGNPPPPDFQERLTRCVEQIQQQQIEAEILRQEEEQHQLQSGTTESFDGNDQRDGGSVAPESFDGSLDTNEQHDDSVNTSPSSYYYNNSGSSLLGVILNVFLSIFIR